MRKTGIIRRFDDLGRIVIPKELRKQLFGTPEKSEGMPMEIFMDKDDIIIRKFEENKDDVCEWKDYKDGIEHSYHIGCCEEAFSQCYETNFKFCPYCGKKIKVVE